MRRFGSIFPFLESGQRDRHIGRLVANHDFVKAVLRYGEFDEFVFSNSSMSNLRMFTEAAAGWGLPPARLARIRTVSYADLPGVLAHEDFEAFHLGGWGWFMPGLHYIRARHAGRPWPITAVIHSLNGREVVDHAIRLSRAGLAGYDAIFCTSLAGREALQRLLDGGEAIVGSRFAGQLLHVPLGIDDDLVGATGDRARGRARLRIPADAVVLLVLGRVTPAQKMDIGPLCRVLERDVIPSARRPIVLLLAGSATPQDLKLTKSLVDAHHLEAHVRLHANFPSEQKPDVLASADLLVSPVDNTQETFGISVLEAMAAGLPVVASRFDGYKDLVEDGVDGFLVDTWWSAHDPIAEWFDLMDRDVAQLFQAQSVAVDLEQLADRLNRLIGDEALRQAMGRSGRAKVDREYRWSRIIGRYQEAWARLRAEAASAGVAPAAQNPFNLGSGKVFPGYASHNLEPGQRVRATGRPLDELPYNETAAFLPAPVLERCLRLAARGATVGALVASAETTPERGWFAVQWLLKYGLLRIER